MPLIAWYKPVKAMTVLVTLVSVNGLWHHGKMFTLPTQTRVFSHRTLLQTPPLLSTNMFHKQKPSIRVTRHTKMVQWCETTYPRWSGSSMAVMVMLISLTASITVELQDIPSCYHGYAHILDWQHHCGAARHTKLLSWLCSYPWLAASL